MVNQLTVENETIEIMIFFFFSQRIIITAKGQNSLSELLNVIQRLVTAQGLMLLYTILESMYCNFGSCAMPTTILSEK